MIAAGDDRFRLVLNLKVASVSGSFEGEISLADKMPPAQCKVTVSGSGTPWPWQRHCHFCAQQPDRRNIHAL